MAAALDGLRAPGRESRPLMPRHPFPRQLLIITCVVGVFGLAMHVFTMYMDLKISEWLEEGVEIPLFSRVCMGLASFWKHFGWFWLFILWAGAASGASLKNAMHPQKKERGPASSDGD